MPRLSCRSGGKKAITAKSQREKTERKNKRKPKDVRLITDRKEEERKEKLKRAKCFLLSLFSTIEAGRAVGGRKAGCVCVCVCVSECVCECVCVRVCVHFVYVCGVCV